MRWRRRRTPEQITAAVRPGERVLAWAEGIVAVDASLTWAAATDRALYVPGVLGRCGWDEIVRASWDDPVLELLLLPAGQQQPGTVCLTLDQPGSIPGIVRDRVSGTIIAQRHVNLTPDRGARLIARRVPGTDDVRWTVLFDLGLDPADPVLRARADSELNRVRSVLGV